MTAPQLTPPAFYFVLFSYYLDQTIWHRKQRQTDRQTRKTHTVFITAQSNDIGCWLPASCGASGIFLFSGL